MKNINQLKKEIEKYILNCMDSEKCSKDKAIKHLLMIDVGFGILKAKLQTLQEVYEEIDKTYKDLDMGKTIPIFIQRLKQKFQGEEE